MRDTHRMQVTPNLSDIEILTVLRRRIEYRRFELADTLANAPVIVMLHEGPGLLALWKDFPRGLATATDLPVVAYSRFGYGDSDVPPPYAALEMHRREALDVLPELLQRVEISRPILFGHSDGASIDLIYTGRSPRQFRGLLSWRHTYSWRRCASRASRSREIPTSPRICDRKLARYHKDPDRAFWLWNNVWLDPAFRSWNIEHVLPRIDCPVLAIQGYEDEYGTMEQLNHIHRAIPQTQQLRLAQCRHSPHRDHPGAVLDTVADWIRRQGVGIAVDNSATSNVSHG